MLKLKQSKKENKFFLNWSFCSIQAFNGLDEAHQRWEGKFALVSPLILILILSRDTLTDTHRIMFHQIAGHHVTQAS